MFFLPCLLLGLQQKAHFIGFSITAPVAGVSIKPTLVFGLVMSDEALL